MSDLHGAGQLAALMEDAGYRCCATPDDIHKYLAKYEPLTENIVAQVLAMMARTMKGLDNGLQKGDQASAVQAAALRKLDIRADVQPQTSWNVDLFASEVNTRNPDINWENVARGFDHPGFTLPDQASFRNLMNIWRQCTPEAFPLNTVIGKELWLNTRGQAQFLQYACAEEDQSLFTFEHAQRKQHPIEGLQCDVKGPQSTWLCLDLIETLIRLADAGHSDLVDKILEVPKKICPGLLLMGLASVPPPWSKYTCSQCENVTMMYLLGRENAAIVVRRLWSFKQPLIQSGLVAMFYQDPSTLPRVLEIVHKDLNAFNQVLESADQVDFAIALAALASKENLVTLDAWLKTQIQMKGALFIAAAVDFLQGAIGSEAAKMGISSELDIIFREVGLHKDLMSIQSSQKFYMAETRHRNPSSVQISFSKVKYSPEVEAQANLLYQQVYQRQITVDDLLKHALELHAKQSEASLMLLGCILHTILDEFQHLHQYPDSELKLTAAVYGGLIRVDFFDKTLLADGMQKLLSCFKLKPDNNYFKFGVEAVHAFEGTLDKWVKWSSAVLQLPGFRENAPPALYAKLEAAVERAANGAMPAAALGTEINGLTGVADAKDTSGQGEIGTHLSLDSTLPPGFDKKTPREMGGISGETNLASSIGGTPLGVRNAFQALNTYTLEEASKDATHATPATTVQDKVAFLMNNLAPNNVDAKVAEFRSLLGEEYMAWFANYLVVKRAAQEPNFHTLYISFVNGLDINELWKQLVSTTYKYVKVLLDSDLIKTNSGERSLLRNLGSWLGRLTIARLKPVRQRDLDLKAIIYNAYEQGKMIAILPFIGKVLEPCRDNKIFKPPNPWIMGILALCVEIYALDKLKLNLKFEIEMLFRNMNVTMDSVKPSKTLHERKRDLQAGNADFSENSKSTAVSMSPARPAAGVSMPLGEPPAPQQQLAPLLPGLPPPPPPMVSNDQHQQPFNLQPTGVAPLGESVALGPPTSFFSSLLPRVVISSSLAAYAQKYDLQKVTAAAMEVALHNACNVHVERAVTISSTLTFEIVRKDFAFDSDEARVRQAAHLAVTSLAAALVVASSKDLLRGHLTMHLRRYMESAANEDPDREAVVDAVVPSLVDDNLPYAISFLEATTSEKAKHRIDERLLPMMQARALALAQSKPFFDVELLQKSDFAVRLPESLRPRSGAYQLPHSRIYEDFLKMNRGANKVVVETPVQAELGVAEARFRQWAANLDERVAANPPLLNPIPPGVCRGSICARSAGSCRGLGWRREVFCQQSCWRVSGMCSSPKCVRLFAHSLTGAPARKCSANQPSPHVGRGI
eukprot:jgi/Botrbrau1/4883/Bobra.0032s0038.1